MIVAMALLGGGVAEAATETAALRYEAPAACPDRAAYVARVAARGGDVTLVAADAPTTRVFVVRIEERAGRFVGAFTIEAGSGETRRLVEAAACGELVEALALVTVLAVDPSAAVGDAGRVAAGVTEVAAGETDAAAVETIRAGEARTGRAATRRWWVAVGAGAAGALGVTPAALPAVPLFAEVEHRGLGRLRMGARWGRRAAEVETAMATFDWVRVQVDACPRVTAVGRGVLALGACGGVQVGMLRARGAEIDAARTSARPWLAPAASGRARARLGARWFAEADVTAAFPLVRDRFFFAPDTTIHRVPRVVGEAAIVVGVSIR